MTMDGPYPWLIAGGAGLTVALTVLGTFRPNRMKVVDARLKRFGVQAEGADEYDASFYERVLQPLLASIAERGGKVMPARFLEDVDERLREAGVRVTATRFVTLWAGFAVVLPLLALAFVLLGGAASRTLVFIFGPWIVVGCYAPWLLLRRRARQRTEALDGNLPDAIDLIVTLIESGLGLQSAMMRTADHLGPPIAEEFMRVSRDVSIGRTRAEALQAMADRNNSRELRLFVRAVTQAEQMGISIASVLRAQSVDLRERRRQRAREKANTVPVKITIPTVLFIFPTMFLLILGPVALNVADHFGGG